MPFTTESIVTIAVSVIGTGGLFGGIYALLKLRPEAGQITVSAANGALIVQTGVIDSLREELARVRTENERLSGLYEKERTERQKEREENISLKQRITEVEHQIKLLQERNALKIE